MEMRVVLATLFRRFSVSLAPEMVGKDPLTFAVNRPILKPRDGVYVQMKRREHVDQGEPLGRHA